MNFIEKIMAKCEKCGHNFAVKKTKETFVMKEDIKMTDGKNGERHYYRTEQSCKFCGDKSVEYIKKDVLK